VRSTKKRGKWRKGRRQQAKVMLRRKKTSVSRGGRSLSFSVLEELVKNNKEWPDSDWIYLGTKQRSHSRVSKKTRVKPQRSSLIANDEIA